MKTLRIELDFGAFVLPATLFDTPVAHRFTQHLPYSVPLIQWGHELYGSIGSDLGEVDLKEAVPAGGLAYTRNGNYICIFYGQTPAWAVEHIGQIEGDKWEKLLHASSIAKVVIRAMP